MEGSTGSLLMVRPAFNKRRRFTGGPSGGRPVPDHELAISGDRNATIEGQLVERVSHFGPGQTRRHIRCGTLKGRESIVSRCWLGETVHIQS